MVYGSRGIDKSVIGQLFFKRWKWKSIIYEILENILYHLSYIYAYSAYIMRTGRCRTVTGAGQANV
jgi:hypothetical protein